MLIVLQATLAVKCECPDFIYNETREMSLRDFEKRRVSADHVELISLWEDADGSEFYQFQGSAGFYECQIVFGVESLSKWLCKHCLAAIKFAFRSDGHKVVGIASEGVQDLETLGGFCITVADGYSLVIELEKGGEIE